MKKSFDDSGAPTYGSPRVYDDLRRRRLESVGEDGGGLDGRPGAVGRPKRRRRSLTRPDKAADPIPDLVKRDFSAERVNQKWCGDLTEIPTDEGKLYLASVVDLAARDGCRASRSASTTTPSWPPRRSRWPQR